MICDLESSVHAKETLFEDKKCDEIRDESDDKTSSSSRVIEKYSSGNVDERKDNNLKDNKGNGTVESRAISYEKVNAKRLPSNNISHNPAGKKETTDENKNSANKILNYNTGDDGDDTDNRVACKDHVGDVNRNNNYINRLSAEPENSESVNMGQAAPNCKRDITDGGNVTSKRIGNIDGQETKDKYKGRNICESKGKFVEKSGKDRDETERYEDCVIVVGGENSKSVKKKIVSSNSKTESDKISEEFKNTQQSEVCVAVSNEHKNEKCTNSSKPQEAVKSIHKSENKPTEIKESQKCENCASVDLETSDTKTDPRKQQDVLKKKYIAESHIKEGDAVHRSWDTEVVADVKGNNQVDGQKDSAETKATLTDTTIHECVDSGNIEDGKASEKHKPGTADAATNSECDSERLQSVERAAQDKTAEESSSNSTQDIDDIKDSRKDNDETRTQTDDSDDTDSPTDEEDTGVDNNVEERPDEAGKDDGSDDAGEDPLSDSGICFYKSKCLLKNQETMNRKEKVKVDESEPSYQEEAPFERRDVVVKKDRWVTDLYVVDSLLGRGKFGEVKKVRERRTGRQLAAKFIEVTGPQDRTDIINEVEIMKHLQHPRLLQLYDAFENRDRFCLVLELVSGGELFERVINDDFILTEKACVMFMRQICDGVAFMHSENILHLDMKPENILCLTREGNRIKIIDFGLARKYNPKDDLRVLFGTPEFVAPEVVNFDPICPATDMWSVGVICYVLLSGLSPFMGETEAETLSNVTMARWDFNAEEFENISAEAKDFISKLLVKDPRKRMSSGLCLDHQWLRRSTKRESRLPERSLSKKRLRKFVYRRKWQKAINAMLALRRMGVSLC